MEKANELRCKMERRELKAAVVGLGYVGLPLAVELAKAGFCTVGVEIQPQKADAVNRGENYIADVSNEELKELTQRGMLRATGDFAQLATADFIAICVPTPLDEYQQPDVSCVRQAAGKMAPYLKKGCMAVLESTSYPGTTEELLRPILEMGSGLCCPRDFYLAFSPERVDPGNKSYKTKNTPKVVGGIGQEATQLVAQMYRTVLCSTVLEVSSPRAAEMEKLLENTYRNINIALANEMAIICQKMGINIWEVIDAAATKPYGFQAFYPGPGLGGHCIPLDPYFLTWKARQYNYHTRLIETAGEINEAMPHYVVERSARILNRLGKTLGSAAVLVLGVAYKADVNDYRESPALKVMHLLSSEKAHVAYYDPYIPRCEEKGVWRSGLEALTAKAVHEFDLVIICCAHSTVDYELVSQNARFVFDTKNAMKTVRQRNHVELL